MWKMSENSNAERPLEVETIGNYTYIRRNFVEIPMTDMDGEEVGMHWRYEENCMTNESHETIAGLEAQNEQMAEVLDALLMGDIEI